MKKIAYIELDTHAEIAGNFMELMNGSTDFQVDYYLSERIFKQIGKHHSNIYLSEYTALLNQLKDPNYDLIIIGTVHRYFNLFNAIAEKYNTAVIVHNLNFNTISKLQLFKNIFKKDFAYRLKLWLKEDLLSAPEVFKKAKNLLVLDQSLSDHQFQYLPVFYNRFHENFNSENFTIVIPGEVSQKRRNYKKVLEKLTERNSDRLLTIIFLGKARGKELRWLQNFEKKKLENISLQYFTKKVPQNRFDELMNKADVLWCPIQNEIEFFSNKEIYGKTKMSGNIGDAIKYGKFAFFPPNYPSNLEFIMNEKENSAQEIFDFKSVDSYDFQKEYNRKKVSAELEKVLTSLL
ncbi:hypothetical protein [Kaistella polysaccharea]|uniref:hypothetical protein n=1 Tax=Kaistella polysaccharea TaxID=2878534 RepID=UPI001CF126AF|nr:hypothetical protein [Kaistella polysaccharea]